MQIPTVIDNLVRSKRRTIALEITLAGQLIVRAPLRASLRSIHYFIGQQQSWIEKKKRFFKTQLPLTKQFRPGETFLFLGEKYPLTIAENSSEPLQLNEHFCLAAHHLADAKTIFSRWYQQQALIVIGQRTQNLAKLFDYHYQKIRISSAQKRWGSCSARGHLSFSWRLVMAPLSVIDYVIVHELAHLKQLNHSKHFWRLVAEMQPDYKTQQKWLRQFGNTLIL